MDDLACGVESGHERDAIRIASAQHGVVATCQLLQAGFSTSAIKHRVRTGLLRPIHRGVYAHGALTGPWVAEWAAILACGHRAALSHSTSLALYALRDRPAIVHVTRPTASSRHRGVLIHRGEPGDVRVVHGLPVTSPSRTIQDVAPSMPAVELQRLIEEMQIRDLIDDFNPAPNRPGAPKLRRLSRAEPRLTRSEAERKLLDLIRAARLPHPETNVRVGRHEVDMLWRDQWLVVEVDGFAFHGPREAFERDRRRDAELQALGYRVIRITWRRLVEEPHAVVAIIAAALSAARPA